MKKLILALAASLSLFSVQPAMAGTQINATTQIQGVLPRANGGTSTTATGTGADVLATSPTITTPIINTPTITAETLTAGTTTVPPLKFTAGTNTTTAQAGAVEYDGLSFYATPVAAQRQVIPAEQILIPNGSFTLTSTTAAQKIFNTGTNGGLTLPLGTFEFEGFVSVSGMSATSGSFGIAFGGTSSTQYYWMTSALKTATVATPATPQMTYNNNNTTNIAVVTASTAINGFVYIRGHARILTAGTIIPQINLSIALANVSIGQGSYFRIWPIGSNAVTTVGNIN